MDTMIPGISTGFTTSRWQHGGVTVVAEWMPTITIITIDKQAHDIRNHSLGTILSAGWRVLYRTNTYQKWDLAWLIANEENQ